jgi:hypothetical protein
MARVHKRILELQMTLNAAADSITTTAIKFYRDEGHFQAGNGFAVTYSPATAIVAPGGDIEFGEVFPPPTHLKLTFAAF